MITRGVHPIQQVLVQWSNWPLELASWEDAIALQQLYPFAPAWGQAAFQRWGNVSTSASQGVKVAAQPRDRRPNPRVVGLEWSK
jgi:hypothetical protein